MSIGSDFISRREEQKRREEKRNSLYLRLLQSRQIEGVCKQKSAQFVAANDGGNETVSKPCYSRNIQIQMAYKARQNWESHVSYDSYRNRFYDPEGKTAKQDPAYRQKIEAFHQEQHCKKLAKKLSEIKRRSRGAEE